MPSKWNKESPVHISHLERSIRVQSGNGFAYKTGIFKQFIDIPRSFTHSLVSWWSGHFRCTMDALSAPSALCFLSSCTGLLRNILRETTNDISGREVFTDSILRLSKLRVEESTSRAVHDRASYLLGALPNNLSKVARLRV